MVCRWCVVLWRYGCALWAGVRCLRAETRAWWTWRRPTVPRLEPQYHGRWRVSRPSSGWDRVGHAPPWPPGRPSPGPGTQGPRSRPGLGCAPETRGAGLGVGLCRPCARAACVMEGGLGRPAWRGSALGGVGELSRGIRTGRLSALPRVHPRPIDVMVSHAPQGDLVLRRVSRLDAFSGYPSRAWLPGRAAGATTGAPEARPPRSSRTRGSASQVSNTHGR